MNDIVLAREGKVRIVSFNIYVNGTLLNTYHADGVILSTPTEAPDTICRQAALL